MPRRKNSGRKRLKRPSKADRSRPKAVPRASGEFDSRQITKILKEDRAARPKVSQSPEVREPDSAHTQGSSSSSGRVSQTPKSQTNPYAGLEEHPVEQLGTEYWAEVSAYMNDRGFGFVGGIFFHVKAHRQVAWEGEHPRLLKSAPAHDPEPGERLLFCIVNGSRGLEARPWLYESEWLELGHGH